MIDAPTRPQENEAEFAAGARGQHPFAVLYQGEYETPWDGTAVAVRLHARALAEAGVPVFLKSFSGTVTSAQGMVESVHMGGLPDVVRKEIGDLDRTSAASLFPMVKHLVVRDAEHLKKVIIPQGAIARGGTEADVGMRQHIFDSTIIYSVWERDRVDPAIARLLSRVAECWVPSQGNREMLIRSGVPAEKVVVIPHPFDPEDPIQRLQERPADTKWRKFYSIGRWEPRKAYAELVEAFLRAFTPKDLVVLTIKYTGGNWPGYETPEALMTRLRSDPSIRAQGWTDEALADRLLLREGRFPRPEILRIHFTHNIYVCSSHGEAWCLPAFEAALAGNRLCYVKEGGVCDFAQGQDCAIWHREDEARSMMGYRDQNTAASPAARMADLDAVLQEAVPPSYGWESDARWACVDVDLLRFGLRHAIPPVAHGSGRMMTRFSLAHVGQLMKERVLAVAAKHQTVAAYYRDGSR